jgi:hypothetical protein
MHRIAAITPLQKAKVKEMQGLCYSPNQILHALQKDDLECALIPRDIYNLLASLRIVVERPKQLSLACTSNINAIVHSACIRSCE